MNNQQTFKGLIEHYHLNPTSSYIGIISGKKSNNLNSFMQEVANVFQFPDYYSGNMNSFMEVMNDLSWLNSTDYLMIITESDKFLKDERKSEQEFIKQRLIDVSKEWNSVPNYDGEDAYRKKSLFVVHYS
jgi:hypothetical protein